MCPARPFVHPVGRQQVVDAGDDAAVLGLPRELAVDAVIALDPAGSFHRLVWRSWWKSMFRPTTTAPLASGQITRVHIGVLRLLLISSGRGVRPFRPYVRESGISAPVRSTNVRTDQPIASPVRTGQRGVGVDRRHAQIAVRAPRVTVGSTARRRGRSGSRSSAAHGDEVESFAHRGVDAGAVGDPAQQDHRHRHRRPQPFRPEARGRRRVRVVLEGRPARRLSTPAHRPENASANLCAGHRRGTGTSD